MKVEKIPVTYEAFEWVREFPEQIEKALVGSEAMLTGPAVVWHSEGRDYTPRKMKRLFEGDWIVVGSDGSVQVFWDGQFKMKYRPVGYEWKG